jgi:UDP:flavonoid glycosyltransferase YjiC (YdhE family)
MTAITFVLWDGAGNVPPTLAVAEELAARGHDVDVLGHVSLTERVARKGLAFTAFSRARAWDATQPKGPIAMVGMFGDPAMGDEVVDHVRARSSRVVIDCLLFGAMRACREAGLDYVVLEHTCDAFLRNAAKGPLGRILRLKGFRTTDLIDAAAACVTMTVPEIDPGHGDVTHVGPAIRAEPWSSDEERAPTALISLSTYAYPGIEKLWQKILDALDGVDARVVATTGPAVDPTTLRTPEGVELHRWFDHVEILPEVTLVVGHGGLGTTMTALAHGLPLLVLPLNPGGDQPFIGKAVEAVGAGRTLPRKTKGPVIRRTIDDLLADGPHRDAARRLGERIRDMDGRTGGADVIEATLLAPAGS